MKHYTDLQEIKQDIYLTVKDYLVSGETFSLVKNCSLDILETHPQPAPEAIHKYYESESYISHTDSNKGVLNFLYQCVKDFAIKQKLGLLNKYQREKGTLLDIGAGTGDFLSFASKHGWNASGVEVNPSARKLAAAKNIHLKSTISELKGEQFDAVTLWHVLEHLHDLENTISQISAHVKPGGFLMVAVPNYKSFDATYYGSFWAAYDVPRHLWHFTRTSMKRLFQQHFSLMIIKPMLFDAFYVSLLSENYMSGNKFSIRAFWIGLKSNVLAMRTKEYSSLIYIYKKHKQE